jgi:murein DD-endopeptidase MepM/ murein hydrolase activator NlpD
LLNYLRSVNYDNIVSRATNVGKAVKAGLEVMGVISDEVTFSMGFSGGPGAAAGGASGTKRCWYASWVTGNETRDTDPANCAALQQYSFKHVPAATMEKITLHMTWPTTLLDGILVSVLGFLQGRGVYSITTVSMIRDAVYTLIAPLADINLPTVINFPLANATGQTFGNLTAWFDKIFNVVSALLCSLEGRSLNSYDFFLYALHFIFRFGASSLPVDSLRDLILSIITLVNHDPSISTALNRNNDGLIQFLMQIIGPLIHALVIPDNYFSIDGQYGTLIAAVFVGGLGMSIVTFFCGMFLSLAFAQSWPDGGVSAKHWAKGWGLSFFSFLGFWFTVADGSTDGGKRGYTPDGGRGTQVAFIGYPPAASSPYLMPYVGSAECIQGNHGFWSHNSVNKTGTNVQQFSFDFSLNLGQDVLCMRDGVVAETPLDSVDDGDHPDDGNHIVIKHTASNADHDKDIGGKATTTYAIYYHGQKGTIASAFGGSLPAVGTKVHQGQLLFKCNSTGMSRCNHIHVQVNGDDGSGNPTNYTIPFVFKDISGDGVAKSKHVYDSQNVEK